MSENQVLTYQVKNSTVLFSLFGLTRNGWTGVGFNTKKSVNGGIIIFGKYPNFVREVKNHSITPIFSLNNQTFFNMDIFDSNSNRVNGLITLSFELSIHIFINLTYVLFAENPTNENFHTRTAYREKNILKDATQNCIPTDEIIGAGRAESLHFSSFIIFFIIFLILLILTTFLRDEQPLKSRSFVPLISLMSQIGSLVGYFIANILGFEWRNENVCWIETYFITIFIKASFIALLLNFLRYMIFINLTNFKITFKETKNQKLFYYTIKIVNFVSSPWIVLTLTCIYYIFYLGILTLFFYFAKWNCVNYRGTFRLIQGGLGIFLFIILIFFQIIDILSNWRLFLKCRLKFFFITNDPFFFRLETFSIFGFLIWFLIYINTGIKGVPALIINGLQYHFIYFNSGGSIVLYTLIKYLYGLIFKKDEKPEKVGEIDRIFTDTELTRFFIRFAKNEWSIENPLLKIEILKYKEVNISQRRSITLGIMEKYLNPSAPMEVNINQARINTLKDKVKNEQFDQDLFDEIEATVNSNLLDTIHRFKDSKEYLEYVEKKENSQKIMDIIGKKEIKI